MLGNFQNPGNFCLWNLESRKRFLLESGIQLKESGIKQQQLCIYLKKCKVTILYVLQIAIMLI